jgi:hypothetical protein
MCSNEQGGNVKRVSLSILILALLFIGRLGGVNHMDLLFRIDGEFNGSYMGHPMVSLDYNCDGYDDLIASAMQWNPESTHHPSTAWVSFIITWVVPAS